jgi:hypothetical protein
MLSLVDPLVRVARRCQVAERPSDGVVGATTAVPQPVGTRASHGRERGHEARPCSQ